MFGRATITLGIGPHSNDLQISEIKLGSGGSKGGGRNFGPD